MKRRIRLSRRLSRRMFRSNSGSHKFNRIFPRGGYNL